MDEYRSDSRFLTPAMDRYVAAYEEKSSCVRPRDLHPDQPSRTVTCRNLGGSTSDMLRIQLSDGRRRMLTVREGARLQGFPDWFEFSGEQYEQFEQIGNAVPPLLAVALARQVKAALNASFTNSIVIPMSRGLPGKKKKEILGSDPTAIKLEQAQTIMKAAGIPVRGMTPRRTERVALALLAVAQIKPKDSWTKTACYFDGTGGAHTTRQIIRFWNEHYGQAVADSSYDDVRRKDLVILVEGNLVSKSAADPAADVNDGTRGYSIHEAAAPLLRSFGTKGWEPELIKFRAATGSPDDRLSKAREFKRIPVKLPNGTELKLSPGPPNAIQKAVLRNSSQGFRPSRLCSISETLRKRSSPSMNEPWLNSGLQSPPGQCSRIFWPMTENGNGCW